ncbi:hypothetical protein BAQU_1065 [Bifidobacterium aquikefiri]|uniref:Uncharacterized protein n=1 Tax=Bifidobacterium aquikefiri TaxID=1653207 RepID=A0A261G720_9BIFI|nr:hypothetical protein BAQU_1065 [Bifidobacterium aquikefiri]
MPELQVSELHWHHLLHEISDDDAIVKMMLWSVESIAAAAPDAISASSTEPCAIAARIVPPWHQLILRYLSGRPSVCKGCELMIFYALTRGAHFRLRQTR